MLGRAGAAGIASIAMIVLWIANGVEGLDALAIISPFRWTSDHIALVGQYDWAPVALVLALAAAFLAGGVVLFVRRDLGVTSGVSLPGLPAWALGVHGPVSRAFGDQLPRALAWGIGLGPGGRHDRLDRRARCRSRSRATRASSRRSRQIFPNFDLASAGGFLQLFAELLFIAIGFAATTFVSKWASDETEDRLEVILATPLDPHGPWVLAGGAAALLATAGGDRDLRAGDRSGAPRPVA